MHVIDCLPLMTKMYLTRVVDSLLKVEIPRGDEDKLRKQIGENIDELADRDRIRTALNLSDLTRSRRILDIEVLRVFLDHPERSITEEDLLHSIRAYEACIIEKAQDEQAFAYANPESLNIYRTVLEVALEDKEISEDEYHLLEKLRNHLQISRLHHRLLEVELNMYPKPGNELHSLEEIKDAIKHLQTCGILFFCNRAANGPVIVLPDEIANGVKDELGFELRMEAQKLFHQKLPTRILQKALKGLGLPIYGTKDEKSDRLIAVGCRPSEVLNQLSGAELSEICSKLQGIKKSGTKEEKQERIIEFFDSLVIREQEASDDPRAKYYQYFIEFAKRDNKNLYQRDLIKRDRDMEKGFEEGTRYLFEKKLGFDLIEFKGSEHPDGGVELRNGLHFLWDNKGKESEYTFPNSHLKQFKRYIRDSLVDVCTFLVIVPEVDETAVVNQAIRLKHETGSSTDIALITAENLKWVAENWQYYSTRDDKFRLEVFGKTGLLSRRELERLMKIILK